MPVSQFRNPKSAMGKDLMSAPQFRNSQSLPAATCLRLPVASATQTGATTHRQASAAQAGAIRN